MTEFGADLMARLDGFAAFTEEPGLLTRLFLTPQHRAAADWLMEWMGKAGMSARIDPAGTVVGRYEGAAPRRAGAADRLPHRHGAQRRQI